MNLHDLRTEIIELAASHGASNVRVLGAVARDGLEHAKDLDLLVRMDEGRSLFDVIALSQELEDRLGMPVDVHSEGGLSPYLRDRILGEAVPL
jgi:predicted nucleotidyltransferase